MNRIFRPPSRFAADYDDKYNAYIERKRELAHIAKVMYDLQEYCKSVNDVSSCDGCNFVVSEDERYCKLVDDDYNVPCSWNITKADIERLKK